MYARTNKPFCKISQRSNKIKILFVLVFFYLFFFLNFHDFISFSLFVSRDCGSTLSPSLVPKIVYPNQRINKGNDTEMLIFALPLPHGGSDIIVSYLHQGRAGAPSPGCKNENCRGQSSLLAEGTRGNKRRTCLIPVRCFLCDSVITIEFPRHE